MLRGMELSKVSRSTAPGESPKISGNSDSEAQKLCLLEAQFSKITGERKRNSAKKKLKTSNSWKP